jgi:hypothetical protein
VNGPDPEEEAYERGWAAAHADLLVLAEPQRMAAREVVADFAGGDFNVADHLIGTLRRAGFSIVANDAVHIAPSAVAAVDALAAAVPEPEAAQVDDEERLLLRDEFDAALTGYRVENQPSYGDPAPVAEFVDEHYDDMIRPLLAAAASPVPGEPDVTGTLEAVRLAVAAILALSQTEHGRALGFDDIANIVTPPPSRDVGRSSTVKAKRIGRPAPQEGQG